MFDQMFDTFRKATESTLRIQQAMLFGLPGQWLSTPSNTNGAVIDRMQAFQKRWIELTVDSLNGHRESLNSMYKSGIQMIEQAYRLAEAKSPDEYGRRVEDLWRKMFQVVKDQSETQRRDLQKGVENCLEMVPKA
jgi:hypothetical protein